MTFRFEPISIYLVNELNEDIEKLRLTLISS